MSEPLPLSALRVVELGDGLAPALTGLLLAEQGAEVVRIAHPHDGPVEALLARDKLELPPAELAALTPLLAQADVALLGPRPDPGLDGAALRRGANPGLVTCRISAFPLDDPRARWPAYEPLAALAGFAYHKPIGPPLLHPLAVGSVIAGLYAAIGVLAALVARQRDGRGQEVDTSWFEAALSSQVLQVLAKAGLPRSFLPLRMVGSPFMRVWECADGRWVYLHITMPKHNRAMLELLGRHGFATEVAELERLMSAQTRRDPSQVGSIAEAEQLKVIYARIFRHKPAVAWEELLGRELCCIAVRSAEEWLRDSRAAGLEDACPLADPTYGRMLAPGRLVEVDGAAPPMRARAAGRLEEVTARWTATPREAPPVTGSPADRRPPLAGIRVADLSRIIAGPCAGRVLAELGAEVVSIQSETRLDWALSFHLIFNAGKRSVTLDFTDEQGKRRLWALLDRQRPDVLIHNYRHLELARRIGLGPETVRARYPGCTYVHLNAYGNRGAWQDRPGFEQVVQAVSGIQLTYARGGRPKLLPSPVIDIGCGLLGAFGALLGLYHQRRVGVGRQAHAHLTSVAILLQLPGLARAQAPSPPPPDQRELVARLISIYGRRVLVAAPRAALAAWARSLGATAPGDELAAIQRALAWQPLAAWRRSLRHAGLEQTVGLAPQGAIARLVEEIPRFDPRPRPLVRRRAYPGAPRPLAFVGIPLRLSRTGLPDVPPPPPRGADTAALLGEVGVTLPPGAGVTPYPPEQPLGRWLLSVVRWGYFAWRSGNI